jgi:1-Cys peroxiredoxin 6
VINKQNNFHHFQDIQAYGGITDEFPYPIIEDQTRKLATLLGMLDPNEIDNQTGLPMSARAVFIIDSTKKMRLSILYPATTGRNFE